MQEPRYVEWATRRFHAFFVSVLEVQQVQNTDMNTLSNVSTRRGETNPPDTGFTSGVNPEAQSLPTGVSVRYAPTLTKQWFVLRVTYNRVKKAYDFLTQKQIKTYFPTHHVLKEINGKKKRVLEPLIPNLLFAYTTSEVMETCIKDTSSLSYLNYYYDHFHIGVNRKNPPLTIEYNAMMNFIRATSVDNEFVKVVEPQQCHFKGGDLVRVTEGDFKGVVGRVARVAGQQCVVVEIKGVCMVATAYVPKRFIEKVE